MTVRQSAVALLFSIIVATALLDGCGGSDSGPPSKLGDWTLKMNGLTLRTDLQVSSTERYFFGSVEALDRTTGGRSVSLDAEPHHWLVNRFFAIHLIKD